LPVKKTDSDLPPPLKAIGGWVDASWFSASVLSDSEVVGITLPTLPNVRKQTFRLVERSSAEERATRAVAKSFFGRRQSVSSRLGAILDTYGATKAAAFGRSKLLFDPAPTLFFAELPNARVKARAANKLRQELIENDLRGCILHIGKTHLIAMFWPFTEPEITLFINAASPPQPIHIQFDQAEDARAHAQHASGQANARQLQDQGKRAKQEQPLGAQERRRLQTEKDALVKQVTELRAQVEKLQQSQSALGAMEQLGLDDARLKSMLRLLHPDKHGGSEAANEAAKWINGLRDLLKAKAAS
jgi:hypothetical protein